MMPYEEREAAPTAIKVVDRRRFAADGAVRDNPEAQERAKPVVPAAARDAATTARDRRDKSKAPRKNDFLPFIATLATNAMAALGALPQARERGMPVDTQMAREYIDIILMLQERTQGNLSPEENSSLQRLIAELQRGWAEATGAAAATPAAAAQPGRLM